MKRYHRSTFLLIILLFIMVIGCGEKKEIYPYINLDSVEKNATPEFVGTPGKDILRVGIISGIGVGEDTANFIKIFEQMANSMGMKVHFTWRRSFSELNNLLAFGSIDVALANPTSYLWDKYNYHLEALAIGQAPPDKPVKSLIIVPKGSKAKSICDLRGKTFAMTDPLSIAGGMFLHYSLLDYKDTPDTFFINYFYTYNYEHTIDAVATGVVEGASVKNYTLQKFIRKNPLLVEKIKVIYQSPDLDNLVLVSRQDGNAGLKNSIKKAAVALNKNPQSKETLKAVDIEGFRLLNKSDLQLSKKIVSWVMHRNEKH